MNNIQHEIKRKQTVGDIAVDGLLAGIPAGLGMGLYLLIIGFLSGKDLSQITSLFDPSVDANSLRGIMAHLAVSAVYGVIFALLISKLAGLRPSFFRRLWLAGMVYGLLLFAIALWSLLPAVGSSLLQMPPLHLAIGHALYGGSLGYFLGLSRN